MRGTLLTCLLALGLLAGCATAPPPPPSAQGWQPVPIPGKKATRYQWTEKDGRAALEARSDRSASIWRKRLDPAQVPVGEVTFSWWVQNLLPGANVAEQDRTDAAARVIFGFDGDTRSLPMRTRLMFDLAQTMTGEAPPYATLIYVWDSNLPVGTVVKHPRSDRVRKIVVDSGPQLLRRWRDHRRDLAADFRLAFGEEPGPLTSIAVMTDSDNSRSTAHTWYGPVELR